MLIVQRLMNLIISVFFPLKNCSKLLLFCELRK